MSLCDVNKRVILFTLKKLRCTVNKSPDRFSYYLDSENGRIALKTRHLFYTIILHRYP